MLLVLCLGVRAETLLGVVVAVSDGDTVTVRDDKQQTHKIRLAGIDAPETRQPYGDRSRQSLIELAHKAGITPGDTMAIGDGANDLDMIRESGLGIAYRAKPVVAEAAHARLDHADLSAALYLQGYNETELVLH